ncbi:hypothetical protein HOLleu_01689 [Holothuria leucospilota]|uniref:HTH psq-type domain-containing protein n=1 Tax=Holothuria leucospilota TaxID=206669 RepID=A0A9Q1CRC3_HOLLE|nr:hypothetical protein HOLleu_01689 [Holothuria leucospilota]
MYAEEDNHLGENRDSFLIHYETAKRPETSARPVVTECHDESYQERKTWGTRHKEGRAHTYGVPKSALQRRIKKGVINMPASRAPVFTKDEEALLHDHVLEMDKMGFGLTIDDVCRTAFEMAEEGKIPHRFNKEKKRAGYDW